MKACLGYKIKHNLLLSRHAIPVVLLFSCFMIALTLLRHSVPPISEGHTRARAPPTSYRQLLPHTPSIAFRQLPPKEGCRKPVLGVCCCPCCRHNVAAKAKRSLLERKETWCLTSTETVRLIRDGEKGGRGYGGGWVEGGGEIIYLSLHCHHQNDSCIKVGSNERHFNVS